MARLIILSTAIFLNVKPTVESPLFSEKTFVPRKITLRSGIVRRQCVAATPDVSKDDILTDICGQKLESDRTACNNEMTTYIQQSTAETCTHYSKIYNNCLAAENQTEKSCSDAELGYRDCSKYALQIYAYCTCYYSTPYTIHECANVELDFGSESTIPTSSIPPVTNLPALISLSDFNKPVTTPTSRALLSSTAAVASSAIPTNTRPFTSTLPVIPSVIIGASQSTPVSISKPPLTTTHPMTPASITSIPPSVNTPAILAGTSMGSSSIKGTDPVPKTTAVPTSGGRVPVVAMSLASASSLREVESLAGQGVFGDEGQPTKGQRTMVAITTASGSSITIYGPAATAARAIEMNGSTHPSGTTTYQVSRPERSTLARVPMETATCARRVGKKSSIFIET